MSFPFGRCANAVFWGQDSLGKCSHGIAAARQLVQRSYVDEEAHEKSKYRMIDANLELAEPERVVLAKCLQAKVMLPYGFRGEVQDESISLLL